MSRAQYIRQLCEDHRTAMQVLCTPGPDGVRVQFIDDHLGNPDLKFPPVMMSREDFFKVIPHNELTQATYMNALERCETYGLLVDPRVIAKLSHWGEPNTSTRYQHTLNKKYSTTRDFNYDQMMNSRV